MQMLPFVGQAVYETLDLTTKRWFRLVWRLSIGWVPSARSRRRALAGRTWRIAEPAVGELPPDADVASGH